MSSQDIVSKSKLIELLQSQAGYSKVEAQRAVDSVLEGLKSCLSEGKQVRLQGFGSLYVTTTAAREGRHPLTKEVIAIPESKSVKFRQGQELKTLVNS